MTVEFHLLGQVAYDDCLALQRRLIYETGGRNDAQITVLICEHPPLVTVGRNGSRAHLRLPGDELKRLEVRWVSRGGGCILHGPGQLAVYPIAPLEPFGWSVGQYMTRLQHGLQKSLDELNLHSSTYPSTFGVWGRSGLLAAVGVEVCDDVTCHGAYINVNIPMTNFRYIDTAAYCDLPTDVKPNMGCLLAERHQAVKMTSVRAALVQNLSTAFDCERYHVHTGHPLMSVYRRTQQTTHEYIVRAS